MTAINYFVKEMLDSEGFLKNQNQGCNRKRADKSWPLTLQGLRNNRSVSFIDFEHSTQCVGCIGFSGQSPVGGSENKFISFFLNPKIFCVSPS